MADELLKHLYDIREATAAIFRFIRGKTFDDYEQDELLRSGIERKFEMIGEALNRIRRDDPTILDKIREHRNIVSFRVGDSPAEVALCIMFPVQAAKAHWSRG